MQSYSTEQLKTKGGGGSSNIFILKYRTADVNKYTGGEFP